MGWHIEHDGFNWWLVRDDNGGFLRMGNEEEARRVLLDMPKVEFVRAND